MKFVRITLIALLLILGFTSIPSSAHASSMSAEQGDVENIIEEAAQRFLLQNKLGQIKKVGWCESRYTPTASNGSHRGVFQQATKYWPGRVRDYNAHVAPEHRVSESITDPVANVMVSVRMMGLPRRQGGGMQHWSQCL